MPKYHWLPFLEERISGSRFLSLFLVEGDADQRGIDNRAAPQHLSPFLQVDGYRLEDRPRQLVALHHR